MRLAAIFGLMLILSSCAFALQSTPSVSMDDMKVISLSLINQDPDPGQAGDIVEVRIGVENTGGRSVNDLIIEASPDYPFELVSGEDTMQDIGGMTGYQQGSDMRIVKYKLKINRDATSGSYDLKLKYYENGSDVVAQKTILVRVGNRESAQIIYIDKSLIIPGKLSNLNFTIDNVGSAPLKDLTFYWENPDKVILPVGSDNTKYIKYLDVGQSAELGYTVIADTNIDPGLYQLNLYLSYDNPLNNTVKKISTISGIYVGGETDFEVAYSESTSSGTSFSIANVGSNPAYSVSVSVPDQKNWRVTGSNAAIIGNLNKGDYTIASFVLQSSVASAFNGTANMTRGNRNLSGSPQDMGNITPVVGVSDTVMIRITYTDTMGERQIVDKQVRVNSQSMSSSSNGTSFQRGSRTATTQSAYSGYYLPAAGLIVLIVAYLLYRRYKKGKQKNLAQKSDTKIFLHDKKK